MFQNANDFPRLKGKAAEVKDLATPILDTFKKYRDATNEQHRQVQQLLELIVKLELIFSIHKGCYRFPVDAADDFAASCQVFVQLNASLGHVYHGRHEMLFHT